MDQHFILLQMYDTLLKDGSLEMNSCCERYIYSVATFYRHISFLRRYFENEYNRELFYDGSSRKYILAEK